MAANFRLEPNNYLYLYHWTTSDVPLKVSTKIKLTANQWNKKSQMPVDRKLKFDETETVVDRLSRYRSALANALTEVNVTSGDLKEAFYSFLPGIKRVGSILKAVKFLEYYKLRLQEYKEEDKSNYLSYQGTFRNLTDFFGRANPTFNQIDMKFYKEFQRHLEMKDLGMNTIWNQWKNIKCILNTAYLLRLHDNTAYHQFRAKQERAINVFLTVDELEKIYKLDLHNHPGLDRTRYLFIVGSFTGLRFQDWSRVSKKLIKDGVLRIQSHKTNEVSLIPCHRLVIEILDKYNGEMPTVSSNQKTNDALKLIGKAARLNQVYEIVSTQGGKRKAMPDKYKKWELITTHTARRSLCTNLILGGANPYEVMKISGHSNIESLSKYISLNELDVVENLKKLSLFSEKKETKKEKIKSRQKWINYLDYPPGDVLTGKVL
jgi:site-specific recombinase XerD